MACKWCGGSGHPETNCPTRNLVRMLTGEPLEDDAKMPDAVSIMDADELFSKSETELHDEVKALRHVNVKEKGTKKI